MHKKICLLGAPGVGKSSLVRQFVSNTFSEEYLTTVGVKIERKPVSVGDVDLNLLIWDIHGEEGALAVTPAFLKGAAGYLLVVDCTRPATVDAVTELRDRLRDSPNAAPVVVALNKSDLVEDPRLALAEHPAGAELDAHAVITSAKTGAGVESAFVALGEAVLDMANR